MSSRLTGTPTVVATISSRGAPPPYPPPPSAPCCRTLCGCSRSRSAGNNGLPPAGPAGDAHGRLTFNSCGHHLTTSPGTPAVTGQRPVLARKLVQSDLPRSVTNPVGVTAVDPFRTPNICLLRPHGLSGCLRTDLSVMAGDWAVGGTGRFSRGWLPVPGERLLAWHSRDVRPALTAGTGCWPGTCGRRRGRRSGCRSLTGSGMRTRRRCHRGW